jgi:hypothetical protein
MELEMLIIQEVHQEKHDPEIMAVSEDGITSIIIIVLLNIERLDVIHQE